MANYGDYMTVQKQSAHRQSAIGKPSKQLGLWMCTALVIGNMIGAGVFLLPATLAPYGWNAIMGWILTIAGGLCLAFVFAALARSFPKAGGPYAYTKEAFGKAPAFMVAWSYWVSMWVGNAAIATGAVSYLSVFFPAIKDVSGLHAIVTCTAIWIFTLINMRAVVLAGSVQLVTTILKLFPLALVIVIGAVVIMRGGSEVVAPFQASDIKLPAITIVATLTLWSLLGLESATVPAETVKNPETTIPRATMLGMMITGVIYLLVFCSILLLMPADQIANSNAPFTEFVSKYMGSNAGSLIALFAAISGFGALNGWILLQGELPNAMARSGAFPKWLAPRSARGTPVRALLLSSVLLTIVVLSNYTKSMTELFTFVLLLSTTSSLFMFLACSLAALKLKFEGRLRASGVLVIVAVLALLYAVWTIYGAGGKAVFWGVVLLFAGIPVYIFTRYQNQQTLHK